MFMKHTSILLQKLKECLPLGWVLTASFQNEHAIFFLETGNGKLLAFQVLKGLPHI